MILQNRERLLEVMKDELAEVREQVRRRAAHLHRSRRRARHRHRGPDPARGHGRHRHPQGLHQAGAGLDLPRAAPRRQGSGRDAHARGRFRRPAVRRQHAHARALLLEPRSGLQAQGLQAAAGQPAGPRQGDDQPLPASVRGRVDHRHPASARGRGELGRAFRRRSRPLAARSGATIWPISPGCRSTARSPWASTTATG